MYRYLLNLLTFKLVRQLVDLEIHTEVQAQTALGRQLIIIIQYTATSDVAPLRKKLPSRYFI